MGTCQQPERRVRPNMKTETQWLGPDQAGFDRAVLTILDANITTFFVAIILLSLGSGPVKGFAVTLAVGIVTSVSRYPICLFQTN